MSKCHRNIWNFKLSEQRMHKMPLTKLARRYYCLQRRPKEQGRVYSARLKRFYFDDMKWYVCKSKISKISSNHGVFIMKRYKSFTASPSVIWRYFQNFHLECFKHYWIHSHYIFNFLFCHAERNILGSASLNYWFAFVPFSDTNSKYFV